MFSLKLKVKLAMMTSLQVVVDQRFTEQQIYLYLAAEIIIAHYNR